MPSLRHHLIVTMDMWLPYKQAVRECFPEAKIVIDRFHVVQLANSAMDGIRVRFAKSRPASERKEIYDSRGLLNCSKERLKIQEYVKLENLLAKYPELETAYNLKERFRKIYYSSTREVAEMFFAEWEEDIPERMTEFLSVAQTGYMTYMTLNQKPEMISGYMVDIDILTKWLESDDF